MFKLTTDIARRYLFGKKTTNAINIITGISLFGISIGTAALLLILSVFNGFESLLSGLFNAFNPDLKVTPIEGKFYRPDDTQLKEMAAIPGVLSISKTLEEVALFEYKDIQQIGIIKGVDENYSTVTGLDTMLLSGDYKLLSNNIQYGVIGAGLRNKLSINIHDKLTPLTVFMPTTKTQMMGAKDFVSKTIYPAGAFSVQSDSDYQYMLTSLSFAEKIMSKTAQVSALEIKLNTDSNHDKIQEQIKALLGKNQKIQNRYEQDASFIKVMQIEKWFSFLITGLTMVLIAFNLLGALWMIVLEKKKDISVFKAMGLRDNDIKNLFIRLGLMICSIGVVLGFILALGLYFLQKNFGLIGVPDSFSIDAYPIKLKALDFLIVTATVMFIGWIASLPPAYRAAKSETVLRAQ